MKKPNNFFLPEEKKYLLWVFLVLFSILLMQTTLYPKIKKKETYQALTNNYRKELEEMNKKITEAIIKKENLEKIEKNLEKKLSYRGNILSLINKNIVKEMPRSFQLTKLSSEKFINTELTELIPVYIEFISAKKDLSLFLNQLNELPLPMEIINLKIDGLSPQAISVKIQLIFEKRK